MFSLIQILIVLIIELSLSHCTSLYAPFNSEGLRGNITFQRKTESSVEIEVHLTTLSSLPQLYDWKINSFPVFYDSPHPCSPNEVGQPVHDMTPRLGTILVSPTAGPSQKFTDSVIKLEGIDTIWGKSVTLRSRNDTNHRVCSNIMTDKPLKTSLATFTGSFAGNVLFRENENGQTLIFSNLFFTGDEYQAESKNEWKILVTDVIDSKREQKCDHLQTLLDPNNVEDTNCSATEHLNCKIGDLTLKHGMLVIGQKPSRYSRFSSKMLAIDLNLPLSTLSSSRAFYVTVYDKNSSKRVLGCALIETIEPKKVKAIFNMDGVKGSIHFSQNYRTDPTVVNIKLENLRGRGKWYHIHEFPIPPRNSKDDDLCSAQSVGGHHNPFGINAKTSPPSGIGTNDMYEVGDLSGKYGTLSEEQVTPFIGIYVDMNLPLFGRNSIVGRSVVIHKGNGDRWICANIGYPGPVITAVATFVYPVVGKVVFRQERDKPWSETTVLAQLSYSDGTPNNTMGHKWHIHTNPHNRDYYNWSRRCDSAGPHFNPFGVGIGKNQNNVCDNENHFRCEVGDLTSKSKKLTVASHKGSIQNTLFYTDTLLPLSGPNWHSIIGRSVVIHDDFAPQQRGDRMACSIIRVTHPLTAEVNLWRKSTDQVSNISGSISFNQESVYDSTNINVNLHGLNGIASGYHIHKVWVPIDKEFACSSDAVYSHFNPFDLDVSVGPSPGVGSVDQYEVGDLSGKFGVLDNKSNQRIELFDPNLSLIGINSVISRSVVIHKKEKNFRWICGTIRPQLRKDLVREIVGLASFDDSRSLISGYLRFRQLEYTDGSLSDTWIEVDLRYPGLNNRNVTYDHKWAVYISPVGEDAFNQVDSVRCLASGYRWNPYLSKDDIEIYTKDCSPSNPLRCAMGDLSGRHGPLTIGSERKVFSDENLPLIGNYTVMGRSVIIFKNKDSRIPIGCANIRPDIKLESSVAVRKTPSFTVAKFMDHMRTSLNTADWLVVADVHKTKDIANNECTQLNVKFYGTEANRLQLEFSNLINFGTVKRRTRNGIESVSTFYKPCKTLNDNTNSCLRSEILLLLLNISFVITILYEFNFLYLYN